MHHALIYDDQAEFLSVTVPFIRAGLEDDSAVLVVVPPGNLDALRETLGDDGCDGDVLFIDANTWYEHPVRTIRDYCDLVEAEAPRRVRAVAELVWQGRTHEEIVEWTRYEAVVNRAFEHSGARVICGYNRSEIPEQIVDSARRTHPEVLIGPWRRRSPSFTEPEVFGAHCDRGPLPPAPAHAETMRLESADLGPLRERIRDLAELNRMDPAVASAFVTAAVEVAANALRHGTPPMAAKVWADAGRLFCEVADYGHWRPDSLLGFLPREPGSGLGMWGVRLLTDLVQVRTGWNGTVVRLQSRLFPGSVPADRRDTHGPHRLLGTIGG
jgi:anti-sigma regulatory factor (Ser/Thr protein kinase)